MSVKAPCILRPLVSRLVVAFCLAAPESLVAAGVHVAGVEAPNPRM